MQWLMKLLGRREATQTSTVKDANPFASNEEAWQFKAFTYLKTICEMPPASRLPLVVRKTNLFLGPPSSQELRGDLQKLLKCGDSKIETYARSLLEELRP